MLIDGMARRERSFYVDDPPSQQHSAGTFRPGLSVPDLDAFHTRMKQRGITCVQEPKATFGVRIAQYLDPDGLVISVSELK